MPGLTSGLNPNVVKVDLDDIFDQEFTGDRHPNHTTAEFEQLFHQDMADNSAVQMEIFKGVGEWEERGELEDVSGATPRFDNKKTLSVINYDKSVDIPKRFFDKIIKCIYYCRSKIGLNGETPNWTIPYQAFV